MTPGMALVYSLIALCVSVFGVFLSGAICFGSISRAMSSHRADVPRLRVSFVFVWAFAFFAGISKLAVIGTFIWFIVDLIIKGV